MHELWSSASYDAHLLVTAVRVRAGCDGCRDRVRHRDARRAGAARVDVAALRLVDALLDLHGAVAVGDVAGGGRGTGCESLRRGYRWRRPPGSGSSSACSELARGSCGSGRDRDRLDDHRRASRMRAVDGVYGSTAGLWYAKPVRYAWLGVLIDDRRRDTRVRVDAARRARDNHHRSSAASCARC